MNFNLPKTLNFNAGELAEVEHLCQTFNISRRTALLYLKALHIKPIYFGADVFYSLPTFNAILYILTKPGSPGFMFPGSKAKNRKKLRDSGCLVEVTDEILREAKKPETLALMGACGGDTSLVRKLASYPDKGKRKKK